jgi:hypothetical protein
MGHHSVPLPIRKEEIKGTTENALPDKEDHALRKITGRPKIVHCLRHNTIVAL